MHCAHVYARFCVHLYYVRTFIVCTNETHSLAILCCFPPNLVDVLENVCCVCYSIPTLFQIYILKSFLYVV